MHVYLDNAATTILDPIVLDAMMPFFKEHFGNPSSIHTHGREAKSAIEKARKTVASLLNTSPSEIFFTSGGTEADNTAITSSIKAFNIRHAITSPIEHHAVLHTLEHLEKEGKIQLHYVKLNEKGEVNYDDLEHLLQNYSHCFVSLMHGNNEIGNLTDIARIGELCRKHGAIYHSDTVQTAGHFPHDLQKLKVDFIVGSAHKFHGPKGVGFLYVNGDRKINPLIYGGAQERNMRGGTENIYGIVGLAKALELAYQNMASHKEHISKLKAHMISSLKTEILGVDFNGACADLENSLYTVLSVSLPPSDMNEMLLFNLDINKISASAGSACASGTDAGSHVLNAIKADPERGHIRFSFSKYNTIEEIDYTVKKLSNFYK
ncbi:MAG: cysteine desulfurase [Sporocytophaga sp.]|uniref:cysteine desulfurase family protein n=1 Tax=Sporocytophaga sp. TaxID=2231183 RepID=UPI001B129D22|nr:cysteine desulfurase family protein [Sporocytophaga sp.]MBO9698784.1 cysteine desulfurase [Sporocytophaga sp.]